MSKRAEEAALKAYPPETRKAFELLPRDWNKPLRAACVKGYELAEKDLGWISVKDRLPEKSGDYITCVEQYYSDMSGRQYRIPQLICVTFFNGECWGYEDEQDLEVLVDY